MIIIKKDYSCSFQSTLDAGRIGIAGQALGIAQVSSQQMSLAAFAAYEFSKQFLSEKGKLLCTCVLDLCDLYYFSPLKHKMYMY